MSTAATIATEALPADEEPLYEIIDGQRVELPPMSIYAVRVASRLFARLNVFGLDHDIGEGVCEGLFKLPLPVGRNRRPDLAFVRYERWAKGRPLPEADNAWDVVPDLAVEVTSPKDLVDELSDKIDEYFRAGVFLVWVIYPRLRLVYVYESLTQVRILTRTDTLEGGTVLPGFQLPLADLFQEERPASQDGNIA
jgi:Uma2 family endonuclease